MSLDLFAGILVADHDAAVPWYTALLGLEPSFQAHDTETVGELAEHRFVYVEQDPEAAGHSEVTLFVEDLDERVAGAAARGDRAHQAGDLRQRCAQGDLQRRRRQRDRLRRRAELTAVPHRLVQRDPFGEAAPGVVALRVVEAEELALDR